MPAGAVHVSTGCPGGPRPPYSEPCRPPSPGGAAANGRLACCKTAASGTKSFMLETQENLRNALKSWAKTSKKYQNFASVERHHQIHRRKSFGPQDCICPQNWNLCKKMTCDRRSWTMRENGPGHQPLQWRSVFSHNGLERWPQNTICMSKNR